MHSRSHTRPRPRTVRTCLRMRGDVMCNVARVCCICVGACSLSALAPACLRACLHVFVIACLHVCVIACLQACVRCCVSALCVCVRAVCVSMHAYCVYVRAGASEGGCAGDCVCVCVCVCDCICACESACADACTSHILQFRRHRHMCLHRRCPCMRVHVRLRMGLCWMSYCVCVSKRPGCLHSCIFTYLRTRGRLRAGLFVYA